MKKESVLAALEPICSCALLPLMLPYYIRVTASGLLLHK